jgi:predicted nuclease of predicted toxin-antitoxin system
MKFFIDANLPYSSKAVFESYGQTWHARDLKLMAAPDEKVLQAAVGKGAILITKDLEFGNPYIFPWDSHHGVVVVRVPFYFTAGQTNKVLRRALQSTDISTFKDSVTVIEPGKIRVRKGK